MFGYKGYTGLQKAIVTRIDDPEDKGRIQVCIPTFQGDVNVNRTGMGNDLGRYFWAQMCVTIYKENDVDNVDNIQDDNSTLEKYLTSESTLPVIYPNVGDVVWIMFEDTDIRTPVYMGSLHTVLNSKKDNKGLSFSYKGGTLVEMSKRVILSVLSYDYVNRNLNNVTEVGILNWTGDGIRTLIGCIRSLDVSSYNTIMSGQYNFTNMLTSSKSWKNMVFEGDLLNKVKSLLSSECGKKAQDDLIVVSIMSAITTAWKYGVNAPDVIIYFVCAYVIDKLNTQSYIKKCGNSINKLHNLVLSNPNCVKDTNKYNTIYGNIIAMKENGDFSVSTLSDDNMENSTDSEYHWIAESKSITKSFNTQGDEYFLGMEVSFDNLKDKKGFAAHDGLATYKYDYETTLQKGKYVSIVNDTDTNNVIETQYCHLAQCSFTNSLGATKQVKKGDLIGYAGQSGEAEVPTLLFMLWVNGVPTNPALKFSGVM